MREPSITIPSLDPQPQRVETFPQASRNDSPEVKELAELARRLHRQLSLAQDACSSGGALQESLGELAESGKSTGFAHVTQRLSLIADELRSNAANSLDAVTQTGDAIKDLTEAIRSFSLGFERFTEGMAAVKSASRDLTRIADQSKLLSLNARIEASRSGPSGAGFRVVAKEMGVLALQTNALSETIMTRVNGVEGALADVADQFSNNDQALTDARDALATLDDNSQAIHSGTERLSAASSQVSEIAFGQMEQLSRIDTALRFATWTQHANTRLESDVRSWVDEAESDWEARLPAGGPRLRGLHEFADHFFVALRDDHPPEAKACLEEALAHGQPPQELLGRVSDAASRLLVVQSGQRLPAEVIFRNSEILRHALETLEPLIEADATCKDGPVVVLANAYQDYHDLGRRLVGIALRADGFRVVDMGLSVKNEDLVTAAREHGAQLIGVSAVLLHTAKWIGELKPLLAQSGLRHVKVIAGGAPFMVDPHLGEQYALDGVGASPGEAVRLARGLTRSST
jgi:methylmalonyl-CoA mutase cobalamin-binding domain/chain